MAPEAAYFLTGLMVGAVVGGLVIGLIVYFLSEG